MVFTSPTAMEQYGHSKSENSTSVIRASLGPRAGEPADGNRHGIFQQLGTMRLGRRVHELADFDQALAVLHALDGEGHQRFAVAAVGIAVDALGHFHAAQAGAILFARDLQDGLLLGRSQSGKVDGAELVGSLPGVEGAGVCGNKAVAVQRRTAAM